MFGLELKVMALQSQKTVDVLGKPFSQIWSHYILYNTSLFFKISGLS